METPCPPQALSSCTLGKHPAPTLLWEPRRCVFCSPDVDLALRSETPISPSSPSHQLSGLDWQWPLLFLISYSSSFQFHPSPQIK